MIKSFGDKETEKIFHAEFSKKLPENIQRAARRKLIILNEIEVVTQLRIPPSNQLKSLKGELAPYWSIRINNQWRIIFKWTDDNAYDVQIVDYH